MEQDETKIPATLNESLSEVIKNLKGQPFLLFVLGLGILFLIAGTTVKALPSIIFPMGAVFVLAIVIWGFLEMKKFQSGKIKTGDVKISKDAKLAKIDAQTGDISGKQGTAQVNSGNIKIAGKADLKEVKIKTGSINLGTTDGHPKK